MEGVVSAIVSVIAAFSTLIGLGITAYKARKDSKAGVAENEQVERRDTVADRDALIERFAKMLEDERETMGKKIGELEDRLQTVEKELRGEQDYNLLLRDHIYKTGVAPPPPRPVLTT